ncbi:ATP-binding protein [Actinomadura adrarensis]|uniref:ATP-binding protein n=1 Tax=Actinomadura adrarensis TaxID=1819600 RepID=A0ABW3CBN5_9ACTN
MCAGECFLGARDEVPHVRKWVRATLEGQTAFPGGVSPDSLDDVELCAGEILANAARYSDLSADAMARVSVFLIGDAESGFRAVRVECHDPGNVREHVPALREEDAPYATYGRGLRIVAALAARYDAFAHPDGGNVAWFEMDV